MMKRPSNLILGFILAVAGIFFAYGLSRMFFRAINPSEVELNEDYENQDDSFLLDSSDDSI